MDKSLLRNAMVNSGILTVVLGLNTAGLFQVGGLTGALLGAIGLYATYATGRDTVNLYKSLN